MKFYLVLISSITLFSCGKESLSQLDAETGHGSMRPWPDGDLPPLDGGVGTLDGLCTAFHLGDGIVATAGHCISSQTVAGQPCLSHHFQWEDGSTSQCVQVMDYSYSNRSDFVIVEVDPAPKDSFQISEESIKAGEDLVILGYPKESGLHVSDSCQLQQESPTSFKHNCETRPGHSGSPVLRASDYTLLGIHNGNRDHMFNYGTQFSDEWSPESWSQVRQQRFQHTQWGPFPHNEKKLLYHIKGLNNEASFDISFDIEDGYDFIHILDGDRVKHTITGQGEKHFTLKAPVIITFESDYAGESQHIALNLDT